MVISVDLRHSGRVRIALLAIAAVASGILVGLACARSPVAGIVATVLVAVLTTARAPRPRVARLAVVERDAGSSGLAKVA